MARGVNKVILIGNLGADPEVRQLPNGGSVANFSLATSESWKDKQTGQEQSRTEWHKCSTFGKLADICAQYLRKGSKVYLEGQLRTRKWQAQDGSDRYTTEVVFREMQMLDSREQGGGQGGGGNQYQQQSQGSSSARQSPPPASDFDSDIPF